LFGAQGKVVSRDEISQAVLNRPWRPEDRSVDQLILNLRQKLALDADGQSPIQSIRGSGYLLRLA
jgi:DNA-binding response OmpR family regulator